MPSDQACIKILSDRGSSELCSESAAGKSQFRCVFMADSEPGGPLQGVLRPHRHQERDADDDGSHRTDVAFAFCRNGNETASEADQQKYGDRVNCESEQVEQYARDFCAERADEIADRFRASAFQYRQIGGIVRDDRQNEEKQGYGDQHITEFELSGFFRLFLRHS